MKQFFIWEEFEWQTPFDALYKRKNEPLSSSFHLGVANRKTWQTILIELL